MDKLDGLIEQKTTALEAIKAAAGISVTYVYGILEEARRHLDIIASRQARKKQPEGEIKTVGQLFSRAYSKWGIYRGQVLKILKVIDASEITDFEDARRILEREYEKEKFGGQVEN